MYVCECVCACMYAFMSVCGCISVCVCGYVTTCTCLHARYMYLSTYSPHVLVYILTTCTGLRTHYMYLSAYSLYVYRWSKFLCECTHQRQVDCLWWVNDIHNDVMLSAHVLWHPLHSNRSDSIRYWIASCLGGGSKLEAPHQPWCSFGGCRVFDAQGDGRTEGITYLAEWAM